MKTKTIILILFIISLAVGSHYVYARTDALDITNSASTTSNAQGVKSASDEAGVKKTPSFLFIGDMMFDRGVRSQIQKRGFEYVMGNARPLFDGADITIANLEGPITPSQSRTLLKNGTTAKVLEFTFATSTSQLIKDIGIDAVSLANNHTLNFGPKGLTQTREFLASSGVAFFGDPENKKLISTITCNTSDHLAPPNYNPNSTSTKDAEIVCVGLVGYHEFAYKNEDVVLREIKTIKPKVDLVVVLPHWGVEYKKEPHKWQTQRAKEWIDAGADVIMGAHPHIIEPIELYKGRPIFYSLGNFMFDQYFSFDTTHGLTVKMSVDKKSGRTKGSTTKSLHFDLVPISNTGITIRLTTGSTTATILNELSRRSAKYVGTSTAETIKNGYMDLSY